MFCLIFFFQAEDGIRDLVRSRGLGDVYKRQNLDQLSRFEAGSEITPAILVEERMIAKPANPVVVMGRGEVKVALKVRVHRVTKSAKEKIEAAGGSVELIA